MSFPANAIGLGAGVAAGAYAGYRYEEDGPQPFVFLDYLIIIVLLGIAVYFGLVLS